MRPVSKETLQRVIEELPTFPWTGEDLDGLVAPRHGVITGFQRLVEEIAEVEALDLGDTGPAAGLRHPGAS